MEGFCAAGDGSRKGKWEAGMWWWVYCMGEVAVCGGGGCDGLPRLLKLLRLVNTKNIRPCQKVDCSE